jgi:hypothetical protein
MLLVGSSTTQEGEVARSRGTRAGASDLDRAQTDVRLGTPREFRRFVAGGTPVREPRQSFTIAAFFGRFVRPVSDLTGSARVGLAQTRYAL